MTVSNTFYFKGKFVKRKLKKKTTHSLQFRHSLSSARVRTLHGAGERMDVASCLPLRVK